MAMTTSSGVQRAAPDEGALPRLVIPHCFPEWVDLITGPLVACSDACSFVPY